MITKKKNCLLSLVTSQNKPRQGYIVGSVQKDVSTTDAVSYLYGEAGRLLSTMKMDIVQERIFARLCEKENILGVRSSVLQKKEETPSHELFSYIEGHPVFDGDFAGFILRVAPRENVETIFDDGNPCGKKWFDTNVQHVILQNLTGVEPIETLPEKEIQVKNMLYRADRILNALGGSYRDVVRTWFYLSDIVDWYDKFNAVRNDAYNAFGLIPSENSSVLALPSSTGIGISNTQELAGTLNLYAILVPRGYRPHIQHLTNKGQKNAYEYGSAFSRGTIINSTRSRSIQLSGTAAINHRGLSLFDNSCKRQIDFTFEKIQELLRPLSARLKDISAATAYLKNEHDINQLKSYLQAHGLAELPCVYVQADICRPELLFELDGELFLN
jgi:enamine deaminase RidA (YjgF/YER057c/UK114 family)